MHTVPGKLATMERTRAPPGQNTRAAPDSPGRTEDAQRPGRTAKAAFRGVCQPADPQPAKETRTADPQAVSGARRLQPAGVCAD